MPIDILERTETREPIDPRYDEIEPITRPFAVEQGYDHWGDTASLLVSVLAEDVYNGRGREHLTHAEEAEVLGCAFDVVLSASELGYFSRAFHDKVEVDISFGDKLAQIILGEEYEEIKGNHKELTALVYAHTSQPVVSLMQSFRHGNQDNSEAVGEWMSLIKSAFPSMTDRMGDMISGDVTSKEWADARLERAKALHALRRYLPILAKQAYIWGRTGSKIFINATNEDNSSVMSFDELWTTDLDLQNRKLEASLETFEDGIEVPALTLFKRIGLWRENRGISTHYGMRRSRRDRRFDNQWVYEARYKRQLREAEKPRLLNEIKDHWTMIP